jgi:hypothetical protein
MNAIDAHVRAGPTRYGDDDEGQAEALALAG